jgi:hypothetical protein
MRLCHFSSPRHGSPLSGIADCRKADSTGSGAGLVNLQIPARSAKEIARDRYLSPRKRIHGPSFLLPEAVDRYLGTVVVRESPIQQRLRAETALLPMGGMQIGADQESPSRSGRGRRAQGDRDRHVHRLQRAMSIAGALPADGRLVCCDISDEWTSIARRY